MQRSQPPSFHAIRCLRIGKLMEDSGSVSSIADYMTEKLGPKRAILAVVLGGAIVTYGGVSLFVAFFVIAPMAHGQFRGAGIPRRLMPAAIMLGTSTFTMSAMPGTPSIQNTIPMPFFGTTPFAAPGLGVLASIIMLAFGLWWLAREETAARARGESFGDGEPRPANEIASDANLRERATASRDLDPAEMGSAHSSVRSKLSRPESSSHNSRCRCLFILLGRHRGVVARACFSRPLRLLVS